MNAKKMNATFFVNSPAVSVAKVLLIITAIFIAACQHSPRKEYYALSAPAADFSANELATVNQVVGIGPVNIPEYLHHNKIGYWKTPQQLVLLDNHYWAEPLDLGIARVLALQLQAEHPTWRVLQFPWPNNQRPNYSLRVDIQRMDAFSNGVVFEANLDWINLRNKTVVASQRIKLRQDASANAAAIAQAFSEVLQQAARGVQPVPPANMGER